MFYVWGIPGHLGNLPSAVDLQCGPEISYTMGFRPRIVLDLLFKLSKICLLLILRVWVFCPQVSTSVYHVHAPGTGAKIVVSGHLDAGN